ncbi:hypothetical protein B0J14DRAFT_50692 [Halenospora varia]|nr:hypothetical protein B0J14DRAFT_50692 [Halenospora varia]
MAKSSEGPNHVNRRSHQKSKKGCKTCKARRVKCDEGRPACRNCKVYFCDTVGKCEYPVQLVSPITARDCGLKRTLLPKSKALLQEQGGGNHNENTTVVTSSLDHSSIPLSVGSSSLDPFDTNVKSKLPSSQQLLHFCAFSTIPYTAPYLLSSHLPSFLTLLTLQFRQVLEGVFKRCLPVGYSLGSTSFALGWWNMVRADPFLHHVMLQVSAIELESMRGMPNICHSDTYNRECIRQLRDRVEDPICGLSNETIGAVATLASLEFTMKNMSRMNMHLRGMRQMVALRGGLHKIRETSPALANLVFWFSLLISQESYFPPSENDFPFLPSGFIESADGFEDADQINLYQFGIEDNMAELMQEIRRLCRSQFSPRNSDKPLVLVNDIHSMVNIPLQQDLHLQFISDPNSLNFQLSEACRWGSAFFLLLPFDNHYPNPNLLMNTFIHKLKSALQPLVHGLADSNILMFWLLSLGAAHTKYLDLPEKDWFIGYLMTATDALGIRKWADMKSTLSQIAWTPAFQEHAFKSVWNELSRKYKGMVSQEPGLPDLDGYSTDPFAI